MCFQTVASLILLKYRCYGNWKHTCLFNPNINSNFIYSMTSQFEYYSIVNVLIPYFSNTPHKINIKLSLHKRKYSGSQITFLWPLFSQYLPGFPYLDICSPPYPGSIISLSSVKFFKETHHTIFLPFGKMLCLLFHTSRWLEITTYEERKGKIILLSRKKNTNVALLHLGTIVLMACMVIVGW